MPELPKCYVCGGPILPDDVVHKDLKGRLLSPEEDKLV